MEKGGSLQDTIFCVFFFNSPVSSSSSSCSSSNNQLIKKTNIVGSVSLCVCVFYVVSGCLCVSVFVAALHARRRLPRFRPFVLALLLSLC